MKHSFEFNSDPLTVLVLMIMTLSLIESNATATLDLNQDKSCATVTISSGLKIQLFENGILDQKVYETIRSGNLTNAIFEVENHPDRCILEVCGYTWPSRKPNSSDVGTCYSYTGGKVRPPYVDINEDFELSSMGCACTKRIQKNCTKEMCTNRAHHHRWFSYQCAILYQEESCHSCIFHPITLVHGTEFQSLNSYQIKSAITRPGCTLRKETKGGLFYDSEFPHTFEYSGVINDTGGVYHKDSENFTCNCDDSIIFEMGAGDSTALDNDDGLLDEGNEERTDFLTNDKEGFDTLTLTVIQYMLPIGGFILLSIGGALIGIKVMKRRRNNDDRLESTGIGTDESIEMQEVPEILKEQFNLICEPQYNINRTDFLIQTELGSGQFGIVYKGLLNTVEVDGLQEAVAIKILKWIARSQTRVIDSFLREVKIFQLVAIGHENIVRFHGACCHNGEFYILTKLCENGSLEDYLKTVMLKRIEAMQETCSYFIVNCDGTDDAMESKCNDKSTHFSNSKELQQLLHWAEQIASGMEYLHRMKIIHLDLAVRNVLLSMDLTAKIADLGLSRKCLDGKDYAQSLLKGLLPPNSFAPECTTEMMDDTMRMTVFVDVWAFGCTVWEIFTLGKELYPNMTFVGVATFIKNHRLDKPELAPPFVYEKLLECWDEVPEQRPSFSELHIFFKDMRTSSITGRN